MIIPQLTEYAVDSSVRAFSTTRHGGQSHGLYGEFNINPFCGDSAADVDANRLLLAAELGIIPDRIILPHQVHDSRCLHIGSSFLSLPGAAQAQMLEGIDALTTDRHGLCIGVSTADCIPILLYDPAHHATAAIHAGWRGTVKRIARSVVAAMQSRYGSEPQKLRAVIGPGIGLEAFEVGQEVYDQFAAAGFHMEPIARRMGKWHIDLPLCNSLQLQASGIPAANISSCGICTWHHPDDYFSARRLGAQSGRIYTAILLT